ncbi:hypothetical protein [Nocardioides ultimimeridianus]
MGGRGKQHPITINPDWSVQTPHDLAAERVAMAFGGYLSCVELVDLEVPALRDWVMLTNRAALAGISATPSGWRVEAVAGCRCARTAYDGAATAFEHVRSVDHLALKYGADRRRLTRLLESFEAGAGTTLRHRPDVPPEVCARIREPHGAELLWRAGIHEDRVAEALDLVTSVEDALPVTFVVRVVYGGVDRRWFADNLRHAPTAEAATWLAWWDGERGDHEDFGRWLGLGVPPRMISPLIEVGLSPAEALAAAAWIDADVGVTARRMAAWAEVDCRVDGRHLAALDRYGIGALVPSRSAIGVLDQHVRMSRVASPARADLAVLLAVCGTTGAAAMAITTRGFAGIADLDAAMAAFG